AEYPVSIQTQTAFHLKSFLPKPMTFLALLTRAGYSVTSANLYDGEIWNHSWMQDWVHPVTPTTGTYEFKCCVATEAYQKANRCGRKRYWNELPEPIQFGK